MSWRITNRNNRNCYVNAEKQIIRILPMLDLCVTFSPMD